MTKGIITNAAGVIQNSINSANSAAASISAIRTIKLPASGNPLTAQGTIAGLVGVTLAAATPSTGVPQAGAMRSIASQVEQAAQAKIDEALYNTYKVIFDAIVATAQAGSYVFLTYLESAQILEITPLLTKSGYSVEPIVDNKRYNFKITW